MDFRTCDKKNCEVPDGRVWGLLFFVQCSDEGNWVSKGADPIYYMGVFNALKKTGNILYQKCLAFSFSIGTRVQQLPRVEFPS